MKKMNVLFVALAMAVTAITPMASSAEEDSTETKTGFVNGSQTELSQTHNSHYTITVPDSTTEFHEGQQFTLSVSTFLKFDEEISVYIESKNDWNLKDTNTNNPIPVKYSMGIGNSTEALTGKAKVIDVPYNVKKDSVVLTAFDIQDAQYAGTYTDILTFTVEPDVMKETSTSASTSETTPTTTTTTPSTPDSQS